MLPLPAPLPQWPPRATVQYIPYCVLSNERWTKAKKRRESVGGGGGSGYAFVWRITVGHAVAATSSSLLSRLFIPFSLHALLAMHSDIVERKIQFRNECFVVFLYFLIHKQR